VSRLELWISYVEEPSFKLRCVDSISCVNLASFTLVVGLGFSVLINKSLEERLIPFNRVEVEVHLWVGKVSLSNRDTFVRAHLVGNSFKPLEFFLRLGGVAGLNMETSVGISDELFFLSGVSVVVGD
jgi:hypothetical protein